MSDMVLELTQPTPSAVHPSVTMDDWVEVVNGEFVELTGASYEEIEIISNAYRILDAYVDQNKLGLIFGNGLTYLLYADKTPVHSARIANVSFIRRTDLKYDFDYWGPYPGVPTLAVEVVSPDEKPENTLATISDYLHYGSEQVWALYPQVRELHQYQPQPNVPRLYTANDTLTVDSLLPGLSLSIQTLFETESL